MKATKCRFCLKPFEQADRRGPKAIYCSKSCRQKVDRLRFRKRHGERINAQIRQANKMALDAHRRTPCLVCGELLANASRVDTKYCSKSCRVKASGQLRRESGRLADYRKRAKEKNPLVFRQSRFDYRARLKEKFLESVDVAEVFARDNYECQLCGEPMSMDARVPRHVKSDCCESFCFKAPTVDHIVPLSHPDGFHEMSNCQSAHFICNSTKAHRLDAKR